MTINEFSDLNPVDILLNLECTKLRWSLVIVMCDCMMGHCCRVAAV